MKLANKCLLVFLSILLSLSSVYSSEELASAIKPTTRAELPDYKSWKTPDQFEEYLKKALGKTSYNFTDIEDIVREYFRTLTLKNEKYHMEERIAKETSNDPQIIREFIYGEGYFNACSGLARYMMDEPRYRPFSEILEDMRYEESLSKTPSFLEWVLSPFTRLTSTSAGYRPVSPAIKSR